MIVNFKIRGVRPGGDSRRGRNNHQAIFTDFIQTKYAEFSMNRRSRVEIFRDKT